MNSRIYSGSVHTYLPQLSKRYFLGITNIDTFNSEYLTFKNNFEVQSHPHNINLLAHTLCWFEVTNGRILQGRSTMSTMKKAYRSKFQAKVHITNEWSKERIKVYFDFLIFQCQRSTQKLGLKEYKRF